MNIPVVSRIIIYEWHRKQSGYVMDAAKVFQFFYSDQVLKIFSLYLSIKGKLKARSYPRHPCSIESETRRNLQTFFRKQETAILKENISDLRRWGGGGGEGNNRLCKG